MLFRSVAGGWSVSGIWVTTCAGPTVRGPPRRRSPTQDCTRETSPTGTVFRSWRSPTDPAPASGPGEPPLLGAPSSKDRVETHRKPLLGWEGGPAPIAFATCPAGVIPQGKRPIDVRVRPATGTSRHNRTQCSVGRAARSICVKKTSHHFEKKGCRHGTKSDRRREGRHDTGVGR